MSENTDRSDSEKPGKTNSGVNSDNIAVVLCRPRYPENIGAAARCMCNMGVKRLIVVEPRDYDLHRILKMATHAAAEVALSARIFKSLEEAVADFQYVVGTTARLGGERRTVVSPRIMAEKLISVTRENQTALMFGPEDRGLSNEDLRLCHLLVNIPTADFTSLNLAQAVMVMLYEVHTATLDDSNAFAPRLASRHELDGMYDQVKDILVRINYINPENPDYWMNHLRWFFNRLPLRAKEVRMIRGICRQMNWYAGHCHKKGLEGEAFPRPSEESDHVDTNDEKEPI